MLKAAETVALVKVAEPLDEGVLHPLMHILRSSRKLQLLDHGGRINQPKLKAALVANVFQLGHRIIVIGSKGSGNRGVQEKPAECVRPIVWNNHALEVAGLCWGQGGNHRSHKLVIYLILKCLAALHGFNAQAFATTTLPIDKDHVQELNVWNIFHYLPSAKVQNLIQRMLMQKLVFVLDSARLLVVDGIWKAYLPSPGVVVGSHCFLCLRGLLTNAKFCTSQEKIECPFMLVFDPFLKKDFCRMLSNFISL